MAAAPPAIIARRGERSATPDAETAETCAAVAEILIQAADEVLLDELPVGLAAVPEAEDLLLCLSVYRAAIDTAGLLLEVGMPVESAAT